MKLKDRQIQKGWIIYTMPKLGKLKEDLDSKMFLTG